MRFHPKKREKKEIPAAAAAALMKGLPVLDVDLELEAKRRFPNNLLYMIETINNMKCTRRQKYIK